MVKQSNKFQSKVEHISASQLLKVLNTLQSYNHTSELSPQPCNHSSNLSKKKMDFQIYMSKKSSQLSKSKADKNKRSITPLKDVTNIYQNNSAKYQNSHQMSKSPSPILKDKSQIFRKTPTKYIYTQKENKIKHLNLISNEKYTQNKLSYQSKYILRQKQKKGIAYVPIQYRAQNLLRQRKLKLQKLQKEKQISKVLELKQCTFKPQIIKTYKAPHRPKNSQPKQRLQKDKSENIQTELLTHQNDSFYKNQSQQNEFLSILSQQQKEITDKVNQQVQCSKPIFRQYKNSKFNGLLDLIN